MKIQREGTAPIVIGKRVTLGAAVLATSEAIQTWLPEYAGFIGQMVIPILFVAQIIIANKFSITTAEN